MKILLIIVAILLTISFLILAIGLFLPQKQIFTKSKIFENHSPEKIFNLITDIKGQEKWRSDVKEIVIFSDKKGEEKWKEIPKKGQAITFKTTKYEPHSRFDIKIIDSLLRVIGKVELINMEQMVLKLNLKR